MIAIIDYGMGNLRSVEKALAFLGIEARITDTPDEVVAASGVILPGVGAFADAMTSLKDRGLDQAVRQVVADHKPFLGICLGMQLLFSWSEENGGVEGLGIVPGSVRRLPPGLKIPHMGWNQIETVKDSPLLDGIEPGSHFYFVHSYYVAPEDPAVTLTRTEYTTWFTSTIARDNLVATQFHPEKSGRVGLTMLKNFGGMVVS